MYKVLLFKSGRHLCKGSIMRSLLFFIHALFAEVYHPNLSIELCMETPCLCPSEGHKHGGPNVTKTSVVQFCF